MSPFQPKALDPKRLMEIIEINAMHSTSSTPRQLRPKHTLVQRRCSGAGAVGGETPRCQGGKKKGARAVS